MEAIFNNKSVMKKIFSFFGITALILAQSCSIEEVQLDPDTSKDAPIKVSLYNEIDEQPATKAASDGFCAGDEVGIYLVNYKTNGQPGELLLKDNQADNVRFTLDEEGKWNSAYDIYYKDSETHVDFYGYYPYADPSSIEDYYFEVAQDQSKSADHGKIAAYEASDFLWAKTADVAPTESKVALTFRHMMSAAKVVLNEGEGWGEGEFDAVSKAVLVTNTVRKSTINLATGEVTPYDEPAPLTGIIPMDDNDGYRAIVVPQTVDAGVESLIITIDGISRKFVDGEDVLYLPGKITTFTLNVSKKSPSGDFELRLQNITITDWQADNTSHGSESREYVVVHNTEVGRLKKTIVDRLEMDPAKIKNLKVTGQISREDYSFMSDEMTSLTRLNLKEAESVIDGVYSIPSHAFSNKKTLIKCVLPDKLQRIEVNAFENTGLTGAVILPEGLEYLSGFKDAKSITNVRFPSTLKEIKEAAFCGCESLMCELAFPESLEIIGYESFQRSSVRGRLVLPEGLKVIGDRAFSCCLNLTGSLDIPDNVTSIGENAFSGSGFNGTLRLPGGLKEIKNGTFSDNNFKGELIIPESVRTIDEWAFSQTKFSGNLKLPSELTNLGSYAFYYCTNLTGTLELPIDIVALSNSAFENCGFEKVNIHKYVEVIGSRALHCYNMTSVVCYADNPPQLGGEAFSQTTLSTGTLEVQSERLSSYRTKWSSFDNIKARSDFEISDKLYRVLNNPQSKIFSLNLTEGATWSVNYCPEWIQVEPVADSANEVLVTVAELDRYAENRTDEVVFKMTGTGVSATASLRVEQYDSDYSEADIITFQEKTSGDGVNIILLADGFDAKDISEAKCYDALYSAYTYFFDIEPYASYKNYFNVYGVVGVSGDTGIGSVNTPRDLRYGSKYVQNEGIVPDFDSVFSAAKSVILSKKGQLTEEELEGIMNKTLIILIENCSDYNGQCYMWGDGSAVAVVPMSTQPAPYDFRGFIHHEAGGHGFAKLADEMVYHNSHISNCTCSCCDHDDHIKLMKLYGFYENISLTGNMHHVPWAHLLSDPDYSNVVDVYEGAFYHAYGVFKSEPTSCMIDYCSYFNAISREQIVKRIMRYAGEEYSFAEFKRIDRLSQTEEEPQPSSCNVEVSVRKDMSSPRFLGAELSLN